MRTTDQHIVLSTIAVPHDILKLLSANSISIGATMMMVNPMVRRRFRIFCRWSSESAFVTVGAFFPVRVVPSLPAPAGGCVFR